MIAVLSRRARTLRTPVCLLAMIAALSLPAAAQPKSDDGPLIAQACLGCHGQAGAGQGSVPKIAGFNRELFLASWAAFKANQRPATIMNRVARGYSDAEVQALADYFSSLK